VAAVWRLGMGVVVGRRYLSGTLGLDTSGGRLGAPLTEYHRLVIGVINYQTGNSQSVIYALEHVRMPCRLISSPSDAHDVDRFVLPGVGSASVTMRSLRERGWIDFLTERVIGDHVPFLGICVGVQVLFDYSAEGETKCLGWLPGEAIGFDVSQVRVPQIGWNSVDPTSRHPLVADLTADSYVYFVNSYYVRPGRPGDSAAVTDYGVKFTSVVARGNVMGTQFHTEKSGPVGLRLLQRFATLDNAVLVAD
jgi:imidazole glycerol-phosphate synthase subunit HisH